MEIFVLYFILASAVVPITLMRFASNEWKHCFQWTEALFPKSGSKASDGWKDGRGKPVFYWNGWHRRLQDYRITPYFLCPGFL